MPFEIATTYLPTESQRRAIHAVLDDIAQICYLPDLTDSQAKGSVLDI